MPVPVLGSVPVPVPTQYEKKRSSQRFGQHLNTRWSGLLLENAFLILYFAAVFFKKNKNRTVFFIKKDTAQTVYLSTFGTNLDLHLTDNQMLKEKSLDRQETVSSFFNFLGFVFSITLTLGCGDQVGAVGDNNRLSSTDPTTLKSRSISIKKNNGRVFQ